MPPSILKKTTAPSASHLPTSREDRNLEIALYHANLLQQRKDVEAQILVATEALLDIPSSSNADPARPSHEDARVVSTLLQTFQQADYDLLIQERNVNTKCGYVLCPRRNRHEETNARFRIVHGKGRGADALKFVETTSLEKWCSDDCGNRALHIKVQLSEEPVWTRNFAANGDIVLLQEAKADGATSQGVSGLLESMRGLDIGLNEQKTIANMKALAIERGDANAPTRSFGLAEVKEKGPFDIQSKSDQLQNLDPHDAIEGYCPQFGEGTRRQKGLEDNQEDVMRTI